MKFTPMKIKNAVFWIYNKKKIINAIRDLEIKAKLNSIMVPLLVEYVSAIMEEMNTHMKIIHDPVDIFII